MSLHPAGSPVPTHAKSAMSYLLSETRGKKRRDGWLSGRNSIPADFAWACMISTASSRSRLPAVVPRRTDARVPLHDQMPSEPFLQPWLVKRELTFFSE